MSEEETMSVEQEAQEVAQSTEQDNVQEAPVQEERRRDAEYNWQETRRVIQEQERQIRERDDYIARIQQQYSPKQEEVDETDKLANDDLTTKAHVVKLAKKMAKEAAQEVLREREAATVGDRIKQRFPDFDDVVTDESLKQLQKSKPEKFYSFQNTPDPYAQAVAVYDEILMMGGTMAKPKPSLDKEKAIKNSQKPLSVNSVAKQSAIGNAHAFENGLTPELKASLWKEMQDSIKRG
jgi:hypothetical protein